MEEIVPDIKFQITNDRIVHAAAEEHGIEACRMRLPDKATHVIIIQIERRNHMAFVVGTAKRSSGASSKDR